MTQVLPRGTRAILDWPVAFVFPCLTPEPLPPGTASLPRWRVAPPADDPSADDHLHPRARRPVRRRRGCWSRSAGCRPTCAATRPATGVQLYRWDPVVPLRTLHPDRARSATRTSPDRRNTLRVPQLIEKRGVIGTSGRAAGTGMSQNGVPADPPDRRTAAPHGSTTAPHRRPSSAVRDRRVRRPIAPTSPRRRRG